MKRLTVRLLISASLTCATPAWAAETAEERQEVSGLIIPLDNQSMYLRSAGRRTEVRWTNEARPS